MTSTGATTGTTPPTSDRVPSRSTRLFVLAIVSLLAWLVLGAVGGSFQPRLSEVQENNSANFLPNGVESTRVNELSAAFTQSNTFPAFLVVEGEDALSPDTAAAVQAFAEALPDLPVVVGVDDSAADRPADDADDLTVGDFLAEPVEGAPRVPVVPSEDGEAILAFVNFRSDAIEEALDDGGQPLERAVNAIRDADEELGDGADGVTAYVAGPAATVADFTEAFAGIDGILLVAALLTVLVILLIVYRSPVLPLMVILAAVFALSTASIAVYYLASSGVIQLNGQAQGILFILVVGATTDYALLLTARYREELHRHDDRFQAMRTAWRRAVEPIVASGATVILGLLCLLLSQLGSNRALGPVAGTGIVFSMLSALTFLPALLLVPMALVVIGLVGAGAALGAVASVIAGGPVAVAAAAGAIAGLIAVVPVVRAVSAYRRRRAERTAGHGEAGRWVFWPRVPHVDGAADGTSGIWSRIAGIVGRHPRRTWIGVLVLLFAMVAALPLFRGDGTAQSDTFLTEVESVTGGEALARHFPAGSDDPAVVITPEDTAKLAQSVVADNPGVASVSLAADPVTQQPLVVDGKVLINAVLADPSDSTAAEETVRSLREELDEVSEDALVGGGAAIQLDVLDTSNEDLTRIIPAVLLVILVVLALLLRALVAPLLIIVANVLSFAATIGVSALFFNYVFRFPGSDPAIVLFGFVFLVALGIDYSIFLMTRVREESVKQGTRPGILTGLAVTGGVITSAGIVLAATFASLATLPILFLAQIAFIVAFGVLLDTFVVRSLLLPALGYDIGRAIWWPSRLSREAQPSGAAPEKAPEPVG